MPISKPRNALGAAAVLSLSTIAAVAQQAPAPPPAADKPAATAPVQGPQTSPAPRKQAVPPAETPAGHDLIGRSVFSSDGTKVGAVRTVNTGPDGNIAALHVKTGGFLGFGGRIVAIPEGSFARKGPDIRLKLSADQVENLPDVEEAK